MPSPVSIMILTRNVCFVKCSSGSLNHTSSCSTSSSLSPSSPGRPSGYGPSLAVSLARTSFSSSSRKMEDTFSEKTVGEIVKACVEMGKVKTGALIVVERKESLKDYERTGIEVDGLVTSQLLINIFEHNTPLHDGAVIVRGNRVTFATCYLPLSDNLDLSKELGTRHRAGVGVSETTDSMTLIVSEETGGISMAYEGELRRHLSAEELRERMRQIMDLNGEDDAKGAHKRRGKNRAKSEKKDTE